MAPFHHVALWAPESTHEKISEPGLGAGQVPGRVHGSQHVVFRDLSIKGPHKSAEALFADGPVHVVVFHWRTQPPASMSSESDGARVKTDSDGSVMSMSGELAAALVDHRADVFFGLEMGQLKRTDGLQGQDNGLLGLWPACAPVKIQLYLSKHS